MTYVYKLIGGTLAILACLYFALLWLGRCACVYGVKAFDWCLDGCIDVMLESENE